MFGEGDWVEVKFNGRKALQVLVSASFKEKVCGLCGNFNGEAEDDGKLGDECLPPGAAAGSIADVSTLPF